MIVPLSCAGYINIDLVAKQRATLTKGARLRRSEKGKEVNRQEDFVEHFPLF